MITVEQRREQKRLATKRWRDKNPSDPKVIKARNVKRQFGLTPEQYDEKLKSQNNLCALCNRPFGETHMLKPALDHNHETKVLRDFIHNGCNVAIGIFEDNPELCDMAKIYLLKHV